MPKRYEPAHTSYPLWPWIVGLLAVAGTVWGVSEWVDYVGRLGS